MDMGHIARVYHFENSAPKLLSQPGQQINKVQIFEV